MKAVGSALLVLVGLTLAAGAGAQTAGKDTAKLSPIAKKLVGVWRVVKSDEAPPNARVEFTTDGKVNIRFTTKGRTYNPKGTYKLAGNKLTTRMALNGKERTEMLTIQTLNDTTLVMRTESGTVDEYERQK
jgi:uncharacterized protein (TIGR03066 family)